MKISGNLLKYIKLQRTEDRPEMYETLILKEYIDIKPFLPETLESVLDIGCGIGGIDFFLYSHGSPKITFLDRDGEDLKPGYGFKPVAEKYNYLNLTEEFCKLNDISDYKLINIEKEPFPTEKFDLVISLFAMGYHFPVDTYKLNYNHLIIDIRKNTCDLDKVFPGYKVIEKGGNYERIIHSK